MGGNNRFEINILAFFAGKTRVELPCGLPAGFSLGINLKRALDDIGNGPLFALGQTMRQVARSGATYR